MTDLRAPSLMYLILSPYLIVQYSIVIELTLVSDPAEPLVNLIGDLVDDG